MATKTRKDRKDRTWEYCDCEGTWTHTQREAIRDNDGKVIQSRIAFVIGCADNNGSKWMIWSDRTNDWEYKTLKKAMEAC